MSSWTPLTFLCQTVLPHRRYTQAIGLDTRSSVQPAIHSVCRCELAAQLMWNTIIHQINKSHVSSRRRFSIKVENSQRKKNKIKAKQNVSLLKLHAIAVCSVCLIFWRDNFVACCECNVATLQLCMSLLYVLIVVAGVVFFFKLTDCGQLATDVFRWKLLGKQEFALF